MIINPRDDQIEGLVHNTTIDSEACTTARSDLFHLEKLGYVEKRKTGKKFIFIFERND
jgi:hypothetical protein